MAATTGGPQRGAHQLAYLRPSARAREARHRRALLVGIGALLMLSLTPVMGRHLFGTAQQLLTGVDHLGSLCLVAVHLLLAPVHSGLHLLLAAGVAYAAAERAGAWRRARRALAPIEGLAPVPGDAFWRAAVAVGLPPDRVRVVDGLPTPAFTAGWLSPVVYAARELAEGPRRVADDELAAVLAHEGAHLARRDPLRLFVLRAMAGALFWVPALRKLADDVADDAEVRADDRAADLVDPLTLAAALVALAAWRVPAAGPGGAAPGDHAVAFVRADLLDRRVRRLAGEDAAPASRVTRGSVVGAALALALVWASGIVDVHALPHHAEALAGVRVVDERHCQHGRRGALGHLLCRSGAHGGWITEGGSDCPHRAGAGGAAAALGTSDGLR